MTTGDDGPAPPDAEHYLDLSDVQDEQSGPHFDVVLRGYDRRQVDDHVAGLRRMVAQLKAQLAVRQRRTASASGPGSAVSGAAAETIPEARPSADSAPTAAPSRPDGSEPSGSDGTDPDTVGAFNDRLQGILAAAEQEAQMVRSRAAESLLAEHSESRAALADLRAQRDAVFDDLVRLRGWLDELVTTAGRPSSPPPAPASPVPPRPGPWHPRGPAPGPSRGYSQAPRGRPQPPRHHPAPSVGRDGAATTDPEAMSDTEAGDPNTAEMDLGGGEAGVVSGERPGS